MFIIEWIVDRVKGIGDLEYKSMSIIVIVTSIIEFVLAIVFAVIGRILFNKLGGYPSDLFEAMFDSPYRGGYKSNAFEFMFGIVFGISIFFFFAKFALGQVYLFIDKDLKRAIPITIAEVVLVIMVLLDIFKDKLDLELNINVLYGVALIPFVFIFIMLRRSDAGAVLVAHLIQMVAEVLVIPFIFFLITKGVGGIIGGVIGVIAFFVLIGIGVNSSSSSASKSENNASKSEDVKSDSNRTNLRTESNNQSKVIDDLNNRYAKEYEMITGSRPSSLDWKIIKDGPERDAVMNLRKRMQNEAKAKGVMGKTDWF